MLTAYTSPELYHFVGSKDPDDDESNFRILGKVLTDLCISHSPHHNDWGAVSHTVNWDRSLENGDLVIPTITCYADIPFDGLGIHVKKYGRFGLSL